MRPTLGQIATYLSLEDEVTVLELLDINSEELVECFKHKIRERKTYLNGYYEDNTPEDKSVSKYTESSRLGSKKVWEDAGFDLEEDAY